MSKRDEEDILYHNEKAVPSLFNRSKNAFTHKLPPPFLPLFYALLLLVESTNCTWNSRSRYMGVRYRPPTRKGIIIAWKFVRLLVLPSQTYSTTYGTSTYRLLEGDVLWALFNLPRAWAGICNRQAMPTTTERYLNAGRYCPRGLVSPWTKFNYSHNTFRCLAPRPSQARQD